MNSWIIPAVSASIASGLALLLAYFYIHSRHGERFFAWWTWSWAFYTLRNAFHLSDVLLGPTSWLPVLGHLCLVAQAMCLLQGALVMTGRSWPKHLAWAGCAVAAWVLFASVAGQSRYAAGVPVYVYAGFLQIWTGAFFLKLSRPRGFGDSLAGWSFIAWGAHKLDFPLLSTVTWFAPWGFIIGACLGMLAALGQLLWYFERIHQRLIVSEGRYRELFELAPLGIFLASMRAGVLSANRKASEILGYEPHELLGLNAQDFIHPEDMAAQPVESTTGSLAPGQSVRVERRYRRKDGEYILAEIDLVKLHEEDRLLVIFQDVSELHAAMERVEESESRFRQMAEHIDQIFFLAAPDYSEFFYVSPAYERIWDNSPQSLYANPASWLDNVHPDDVQRIKDLLSSSLGSGQYESHYRVVHPDGTVRTVLARAFELQGPDGKPYRVAGSVTDVTERERAENDLRKSLAINQMILRHAPMGVCVHDGETRQCLVANDLLESLLEDRMGERLIDDFRNIPSWRESGMAALAEEALAGFGTRRKEFRVRTPSGKELVLDCMFARFDVDSKPYLLLVVNDVTERVRMSELMIQSEKMMSVGGLAAGMAHEINNPLSGILQGAQVVQKRLDPDTPLTAQALREADLDSDAFRRFIDKRDIMGLLSGMRQSASRAAKIVADMLEFSRKGDSHHELSRLEDILDTAVELCSNDYDLKKNYDFRHILIEREYDPTLGPVECSPTQIEQVVMNLLRNASQALREHFEDGRQPRIVLRTKKDGDRAHIEVEDNGPGMPQAVRRRVFEPFFTTKQPGQGTGLGLSVSYFIITSNHRGSIEVESEPGVGAKFIIRLPMPGEADTA